MSTLWVRVDKAIDKVANILFIVIASCIAILIIGLLFKLCLQAVLEPLYAYLQPRLGFFFIPFAFLVLVIVGGLGELVGSLMAETPSVIRAIKEGRLFAISFKYLKHLSTFIGLYGVAKLLLLLLQQQENQGLGFDRVAELVWVFFTAL